MAAGSVKMTSTVERKKKENQLGIGGGARQKKPHALAWATEEEVVFQEKEKHPPRFNQSVGEGVLVAFQAKGMMSRGGGPTTKKKQRAGTQKRRAAEFLK